MILFHLPQPSISSHRYSPSHLCCLLKSRNPLLNDPFCSPFYYSFLSVVMMHAGVPFNSRSYDVTVKEGGGWDFSDWHNEKPALKAKNPLMNLPYVVDGDVVIAQTNACFLYLGRKCKMLGTNELELTQCK